MRIQSPSLVELHAFLAVVRTRSFRKAAEELCVTQAAVSRAVIRLEAELGQEVFSRTTGGVILTPLGEDLLQMIAKPVAALEAAAVRLRKKLERLRLRLSVITSLGHLWLMPRLEDFQRRHPEIELEFRQYRHDEDFTRDDVDLWIDVKNSAQQQWPRQISAQYLIGKEILAVCTPQLAQGLRTPEELLQLPLLYHSSFPDNWNVWAAATGARMPTRRKGSGFDLVMNLIGAAKAGMGVAIVQQCMVQADLQAGRLVSPVGGIASTGRGYYLCRRRAQVAHPASDLFSAWLMEMAAQQAADSLPSSP